MNKKEIIALLKEQKHEKIKVAIIDIDGVARGKFMSKNKFISALESEFGFCQIFFNLKYLKFPIFKKLMTETRNIINDNTIEILLK